MSNCQSEFTCVLLNELFSLIYSAGAAILWQTTLYIYKFKLIRAHHMPFFQSSDNKSYDIETKWYTWRQKLRQKLSA